MSPINISKDYWKLYRLRWEAPKRKLLTIPEECGTPEMLAKQKTTQLILKAVGKEGSILDIGAGTKILEKALVAAGFRGTYRSMDIDETYNHDFHSLEEITGQYDCVCMLELIEHLDLNTGINYMERAKGFLKEDGTLVISTPNASHINVLWAQDMTHIQQYPFDGLYAILRLLGFKGDIDIYRLYLSPRKHPNLLKDIVKRRLLPPFTKLFNFILRVDYAQNIMVFARLRE